MKEKHGNFVHQHAPSIESVLVLENLRGIGDLETVLRKKNTLLCNIYCRIHVEKMGPKKGGAKVKVDFSNPANLIQVLQMLSANDTSTIKTAEKALKPFMKEPSNAAMLIGVLGSCTDAAVRHHAALILRKKLNGFYPKYPVAQQILLKSELIRLILAEPDSDCATAIAGAIASTASAAFEGGQEWPELFNLLVQLLAEPEERLRLLTFKILGEVLHYY